MNLFTTPIDKLIEAGIIPEPEPDVNKKMNLLTFACVTCGQEYKNDYVRNNPDRVARGMYCTDCQAKTMFLVKAIPYTIHFRDYTGYQRASFSDDVSQQCWRCGTGEHLTTLTLSNDQEIKACPEHLRPLAKEACKARYRKQEPARPAAVSPKSTQDAKEWLGDLDDNPF